VHTLDPCTTLLHVLRKRKNLLGEMFQLATMTLLFLGKRRKPRDEIPEARSNGSSGS
jgi:hypothetical protein